MMNFYTRMATALLLLAAAVALHLTSADASLRQRILIDSVWKLHVDSVSQLRGTIPIVKWRTINDDNGIPDAATYASPTADTTGPNWHDSTTGQDTFQGRAGYAWFTTTLPELSGPGRAVNFSCVDDNADIYLNGIHLLHHEGWNDPFIVPLDSAWKIGGSNVLTVLVQNTAGAGGITQPVWLGTALPGQSLTVTPTSDDRSWTVVHLPNDYVVDQTFQQGLDASHGSLPTPKAWYRKQFTVPVSDKGKSIWIDFDGVYRDAIVYLNGIELGEHQSGYTPARYTLSGNPALHYATPNDLAVRVDPTKREGWWYEGGGIYRHVWLNVASPIHIAPWGTYVVSTIPPGQDVSDPTSSDVAVVTTLHNDSAQPVHVTVKSTITNAAGDAVASTSTTVMVGAGASVDVPQKATVQHPSLWSVDRPNMYALKSTIVENGAAVDDLTTPFGIRTIRFDKEQGFFLNGKHVEIQGVCNHQDFAGVGIGMPDSVLAWRTAKLREFGCNAFRTSHNMVADEILDDCDKQGMLVMDENRHLGDTYDPKTPPGTGYTDLSDLDELIQRDRNHPSVIMWSMCNEEPLQGSSEGERIFKAMMDRVHVYDKTRPITCAMSGGYGTGFSLVEDLQGFNYCTTYYDYFYKKGGFPPMFGSEVGSTVAARGVYVRDDAAGLVSNYPTHPGWAQTPEDTWQPTLADPYIAGGFVWTGFDYKGEPTPYGWPDINSNFGILDEAGFPKDMYYYYKSVWLPDQPLVHIFPDWNLTGQEGKPIDVYCWGNTAKVELFLNGVSLGAKDMPAHKHVDWTVPFAPGTLTVKGYDSSGKVTASETESTTGQAASLKLTCKNPLIAANGEDVSMVEVSVLDSHGDIVPSASTPVTFTASNGAIVVGTGNGDPTDHTPDHATTRNASHGRVLGIVGASNTTGDIVVTASSPGLPDAHYTIVCK